MGNGCALLLLLLSAPAWLLPAARGDVCEPGTVISGEAGIERDLVQARLEAWGGEGDWEVTRPSVCAEGKRNGKCGAVGSRVLVRQPTGVDAMLAVGSAFRNVSLQQRSALGLVEKKDYGEAVQVLLRSVAVLIFPHQEVGFLRRWHEGLAMPGALYRKPRLAMGGALVLAAQCQLEIGQGDHEPKDLKNAHHFLLMAAALLASDGLQKNADALSLLKQISSLRTKTIKSLQDIFELLEKLGDSASGRGLKQPDLRNLIASLSMVDKNLECHSASDVGQVEECLLSAISSIAELLPPIILRELNIPWVKAGSRNPACKGMDGAGMLGGCFTTGENDDSESTSAPECTHESSECLFNVHRILYGSEKKDYRSAKLGRGDKIKAASPTDVDLGTSDVRIGDIIRTDHCEEALDGSLGHIGDDTWHGDQGDVHERKPRHISKVSGMQLGYISTGIGLPSMDFVGSEPWALPLTLDSGVLMRKNHVETCPSGECLGIVDIFGSWSAEDLGLIEECITSFLDRSVLEDKPVTGKEEALLHMGVQVKNAMDNVRFLPQELYLIDDDVGKHFGSKGYVSERRSYKEFSPNHKSYGFHRNRNSGENHFNWREFWRDLEKTELFIVVLGLGGLIGVLYLYGHEPMGRLFQLNVFPIIRAPSCANTTCAVPVASHCGRGTAKYEKTDPEDKVNENSDSISTLLSNGESVESAQAPKPRKGKSKGCRSTAQQRSPTVHAEGKIVGPSKVNDMSTNPDLKTEKGWTPSGNSQKSKWDWQEVGPGGRITKRKEAGSGKKLPAYAQTVKNDRPELKPKKTLKPAAEHCSQPNKEHKPGHRPHKAPPGFQPESVNSSNSWFSGHRVRFGKDVKSAAKMGDTSKASRPCKQLQYGHPPPNMAITPSKKSQSILIPPSTVLSALDPPVQEPKSGRAMVAGVIGELINHRNQYIDDGTPEACYTSTLSDIPTFSRSQSLTSGHQSEHLQPSRKLGIGDVPTPYPGVSMPAAVHQRAASMPGIALQRRSSGALLGMEDFGAQQHVSGDHSQQYGGHSKLGRSIWSVGPNPSIWSSNLGLQLLSHSSEESVGDPGHGPALLDMNEDLKDRLPKSLLSDQ